MKVETKGHLDEHEYQNNCQEKCQERTEFEHHIREHSNDKANVIFDPQRIELLDEASQKEQAVENQRHLVMLRVLPGCAQTQVTDAGHYEHKEEAEVVYVVGVFGVGPALSAHLLNLKNWHIDEHYDSVHSQCYMSRQSLIRVPWVVHQDDTKNNQGKNRAENEQIGAQDSLVAMIPVEVDVSLHILTVKEAHVFSLGQSLDKFDLHVHFVLLGSAQENEVDVILDWVLSLVAMLTITHLALRRVTTWSYCANLTLNFVSKELVVCVYIVKQVCHIAVKFYGQSLLVRMEFGELVVKEDCPIAQVLRAQLGVEERFQVHFEVKCFNQPAIEEVGAVVACLIFDQLL